MLYIDGKLIVEDAALRRIARSKLRSALDSFEMKSDALVASLLNKLSAKSGRSLTVDGLLNLIEQHPQLQSEKTIIRRYVNAFPEFADLASAAHNRIHSRARRRIEAAFAPFEYQHRFQFTKGLRC